MGMQRRIAIGGCCVAIVMSASCAAASAAQISARPDNCNGGFNPFAYTQAAITACNWPTWPLTRIEDLPGGGKAYVYNEDHGMVVKDLQPPAGFDPLTATNDQLDEYGFPTRPDSTSADFATWWSEMANWKGAADPPPFETANPNVTYDSANSYKWAGYQVNAGTYTHSEAWYYEPTIYGSQCSGDLEEASWAGIGKGTSSNPLAQDGTEYGNPSSGFAPHQSWWEMSPYNGPQPMGLIANSGWQFDASTKYFSSTNSYRFYIYNYKSGNTDVVDDSSPVTSPPNDQAEMIIERPGGSYLANFGNTDDGQYHGWHVKTAQANGAGIYGTPKSERIGWSLISPEDLAKIAPVSSLASDSSFAVSDHRCH